MTTLQSKRKRADRIEAACAYRLAMHASTLACLILVADSLSLWGAREVRASLQETGFLTLLGGGWLIVSRACFPWLGLSLRDDAIERKNFAALVALCNAMLSVALIYAGGNLGEGPSYLENIFSAGLGTVVLFAFWLVLELGAGVSISIAEERDLASGLRLAGFLVALGLIFGRALAGDWHSAAGTIHDIARDGWVAVLLLMAALFIEWLLRPSRWRPFPLWPVCGLVPALGYLALALFWLWHLGAWEGMPR